MTDNTTEIRMGRGLAAPERAVSSSERSVAATSRPRAWRRIGLVGAALSSPLAMAAQ